MTDQPRVLVIEQDRAERLLMCRLLERAGYGAPVAFGSAVEAVAALPGLLFDMAVVDHRPDGVGGLDVIAMIRLDPGNAGKPIVVVTADGDPGVRTVALEAGATEFVMRPVEPMEFTTRMRNLAELWQARRKVADLAAWMREEVVSAISELRQREEEIIHRLTLAASYKDEDTAAHTIRMAGMCGAIARALGLDTSVCRDIELAAPMHDIGKVGIRDEVLLKPGRLNKREMAHVREHARIGGEILEGSSCDLLRLAAVIATTHHERWDGTGYPNRLAGADIPLVGRIAAVADVFDALVNARPYKRAWTLAEATTYIREQSGRQFDPACVEAFLHVVASAGEEARRTADAA